MAWTTDRQNPASKGSSLHTYEVKGAVRHQCLLRSLCFGRVRCQRLLHSVYVPQWCPLLTSAPFHRTSLPSIRICFILRPSPSSVSAPHAARCQRLHHYALVSAVHRRCPLSFSALQCNPAVNTAPLCSPYKNHVMIST